MIPVRRPSRIPTKHLRPQNLVRGLISGSYPQACRRVFVDFSTMTRDIVLFARPPTTSLVRRLGNRPMCSNIAMNASITYPFIPDWGSTSSTPWPQRQACHAIAVLACEPPNCSSMPSSRPYRNILTILTPRSHPVHCPIGQEPPPNHTARGLIELRKQSLTLRDSINATLRLLWAVGAA